MKFPIALALVLCAWCWAGAGVHAGIATDPVLRVDTGGHASIIYRLAVDPAERIVATASRDKTLRLWSLETGALLRTLRVPIGPGEEGALHAVAFSPDGKTLATGGWTCESVGNWCLYLFEVETGRLLRRIDGLPNRAMYLSYSHDGGFLAASLKEGAGVIVLRTDDYSVTKHDAQYGQYDASWVEFLPDGRLVTVSRDGVVRLYDRDLNLAEVEAQLAGDDPVCITVSPDGALMAIGYDVTPAVSILSATDLRLLYEADTRGAEAESFKRLAWSADGGLLYGAGGFERSGRNVIRRWADAGRGRPTDLAALGEFVTHLAVLRDGRVVFSSTEPSLSILAPNGHITRPTRAALADYRDIGETFRLSADATTVSLSYAPWGAAPARFSLAQRSLTEGDVDVALGLQPPQWDAPGLDIRVWQGAEPPELNGRKLSLKPGEHPLSFAIAPDAKSFALGTWWNLYLFDRTGRVIWERRPSAEVRALNISPDERFIVAALGDGTIRWYRAADGAELAALFAHVDRKRWVMWTPSGYYTASPGGDALIGWHVNNGADRAADFFGVARFRAHFYRPDIVEATLRLADEAAAIDAAGVGTSGDVASLLPPVVAISGLESGASITSPRMELAINVRVPAGVGLARIEVRADGRPIASLDGGIEAPGGEARIVVPITVPRRDAELSIIAENARGIASEPARVNLRWTGPGAAPRRPDLYLLAVGVGRYARQELRLNFPAKDARDLVATFRAQAGKAFADVHALALLDEEANNASIEQGLKWLRDAAGRDDVVMVFLAGHGVADDAGGFRFLGHEADPSRLADTTVPYATMRGILGDAQAQVLLFIDACHAGAVEGRSGRAPFDVDQVVNDLASAERGVIVFASSTGDQLSAESETWGNGAFTKALVEGLGGRADLFGEGDVTVTTLDAFIARRVARLTEGRQTPATGKPIGTDLLLARAGTEHPP